MQIPVRFHHLKAVARAAQLGKFVMDGGDANEETPSIETGAGTHALLFGTKPVTFYPKARNEKHAEYKEFKEKNAGSLILTAAEYETASRMAESVGNNADAVQLLSGCVYEDTLRFDWLGRTCRVTPDARHPARVVELKTSKTASPSPFEFPRIVERMHYHTQLAWQQTGVELALGFQPHQAFIIAVEPTPPHLVCVFEVGPRMLLAGQKNLRLWMERLLSCETAGQWPGYSQSIVKLDLPEEESWEEEAA